MQESEMFRPGNWRGLINGLVQLRPEISCGLPIGWFSCDRDRSAAITRSHNRRQGLRPLLEGQGIRKPAIGCTGNVLVHWWQGKDGPIELLHMRDNVQGHHAFAVRRIKD